MRAEKPKIETSAEAVVAQNADILRRGRAPRGRSALLRAARELQAEGRLAEASRAQRLIAEIELRHDNHGRALPPARAALRLARQSGNGSHCESLNLLARVYARAAEWDTALGHAREAVGAAPANDPGKRVSTLLRVSEIALEAGQPDQSFASLEQAKETAVGDTHLAVKCAEAELLARVGCPSVAEESLTRVLKENPSLDEKIRLLVARGAARMSLGRPDAAARDFRAALRLTKEGVEDCRHEPHVLALLAVAEAAQAATEGTPGPRGRAESHIDRAARLARRSGDRHLAALIHEMRSRMDEPSSAALPKTPREAARALVSLSAKVDSLSLVSACIRESKRLTSLPESQPPYAHGPLPLRFE